MGTKTRHLQKLPRTLCQAGYQSHRYLAQASYRYRFWQNGEVRLSIGSRLKMCCVPQQMASLRARSYAEDNRVEEREDLIRIQESVLNSFKKAPPIRKKSFSDAIIKIGGLPLGEKNSTTSR